MSYIIYDDVIANLVVYKQILSLKIAKVCSKIGFDDSNIIWISTLAIHQSGSIFEVEMRNMLNPLEAYETRNDFLAEVIIDEITHFQTQKDHGDNIYEKEHINNRIKYYFGDSRLGA